MSDNFDQWCAIRFCFRLKHSVTNTLKKLKETWKVCLQGPRYLSGLKYIQKADSRLTMNLAVEGLQLQNIIRIRDLVRSDCWLTVRMNEQ